MAQHSRRDGFPVRTSSLSLRQPRPPVRSSSLRAAAGNNPSPQRDAGVEPARHTLSGPSGAAPAAATATSTTTATDTGRPVIIRTKLARPPVKDLFPVRETSGGSLWSAPSTGPAAALRSADKVAAAGEPEKPLPPPPKEEETPRQEPAELSADPPTPTRPPPPPPTGASAAELRQPTPHRSIERLASALEHMVLDLERADPARPTWRNAKRNYFPRWAMGMPQEEVVRRVGSPEA